MRILDILEENKFRYYDYRENGSSNCLFDEIGKEGIHRTIEHKIAMGFRATHYFTNGTVYGWLNISNNKFIMGNIEDCCENFTKYLNLKTFW